MPEGDTVWLTAHRLHLALAGRQVTEFDLRVPQLATADLRGDVVEAVVARGKHLLMRFDSSLTLHSHLRMDGSWYVSQPRTQPSAHPAHLIRARIANREWCATGYRIHDLRLLASTEEDLVVGHLGPDLLGPDWDPDAAVRRLQARPERAIAEALLDQTNLAGIGNLYKCEVLFLQGVNPWTATGSVPDLRKLVVAAQKLMRANRDHPEQSTTGVLARGRQHWVYERGGQSCRRCHAAIQRADQGESPRQRSSYWCPTCQPDPG